MSERLNVANEVANAIADFDLDYDHTLVTWGNGYYREITFSHPTMNFSGAVKVFGVNDLFCEVNYVNAKMKPVATPKIGSDDLSHYEYSFDSAEKVVDYIRHHLDNAEDTEMYADKPFSMDEIAVPANNIANRDSLGQAMALLLASASNTQIEAFYANLLPVDKQRLSQVVISANMQAVFGA